MYRKTRNDKVRFESYLSVGLKEVLYGYAELHSQTISETVEKALSSYLHNEIIGVN